MVRRLYLVIALMLVPCAGWAQAPQFRPQASPEDRACRGDAHRYCREAIGDDMRVASCLQEHRERLTRTCRAALEAHGL